MNRITSILRTFSRRTRRHPQRVDWVTGAADARVARARADRLVPPAADTPDCSHRWWHATQVLAVYLHLADLGGHDLAAVVSWATDPDVSAQERALLSLSDQPVLFVEALRDYLRANDRTRSSIRVLLLAALERAGELHS
jgi:hypothetical protein